MNGNYSIDACIGSGKRIVQEYNNLILCNMDRTKLIGALACQILQRVLTAIR